MVDEKRSFLDLMNPGHDKKMAEDSDKSKWLWRYLDASKFVSLLTRKALFFPRASSFVDKREGLIHLPKNEYLLRGLASLANELGEKNAQENANNLQEQIREYMAVSCWTNSPVESVALWNMYTSGISGVCIRTNLDALWKELEGKVPLIVHKKVEYSNLGKTDPQNAFFRKTPEWSFEMEYRFVINMLKEKNYQKEDGSFHPRTETFLQNGGLHIPISLENVIKEIRVHYQAPKWLLEDTKNLASKFLGDKVPVVHSELNDEL